MNTSTKPTLNEAENGNKSKPLLPAVFSFAGWSDENCENPKKDGTYLCLCKWSNIEEYQYHILEFSKKERTYISIGKTNTGVIPILKNSRELVNIVIKSSKYFV